MELPRPKSHPRRLRAKTKQARPRFDPRRAKNIQKHLKCDGIDFKTFCFNIKTFVFFAWRDLKTQIKISDVSRPRRRLRGERENGMRAEVRICPREG